MTNHYITAFAKDPLIRGAVMQSSDSQCHSLESIHRADFSLAAQPMWPLNQQIEIIAKNVSCPTGHGLLDCLRKKDGLELQRVLLATGAQFQPVTDNITIFPGASRAAFSGIED
jgi:hypothetical protein